MRRPILLRCDRNARLSPNGVLPEGFDGVEWMIGSAPNRLALTIPDEMRGMIRGLGLDCHSLIVGESAKEVFNALELAATLQAAVLNVSIPPVGGAEGVRFDRYQDALNFTHGFLRESSFEAESRGVAIAIVAPARGCLQSPVELRDLFDAAHSSAVGACVDVEAVARLGSSEDWLSTLGPRVRSIRVPGQGGFDELDFRKGLEHVPDDRPLIVDGPSRPDAYPGLLDVAQGRATE